MIQLRLCRSAIAALGTGGTLGSEFACVARNAGPTRTVEALSSLVRGACFGLGSGLLFGCALACHSAR